MSECDCMSRRMNLFSVICRHVWKCVSDWVCGYGFAQKLFVCDR